MIRTLTLATTAAALAFGIAFAQGPASSPADPDATQTQTQTPRRIHAPDLNHDPATDPIRARAQQHTQERDAAPDARTPGRPGAAGAMGERAGGTPGANHAAFADALGMSEAELSEAIQGGATLQELAADAGIDLPDVGRADGANGPQAGGRMHGDADGAPMKGRGHADAQRGGPGRAH